MPGFPPDMKLMVFVLVCFVGIIAILMGNGEFVVLLIVLLASLIVAGLEGLQRMADCIKTIIEYFFG